MTRRLLSPTGCLVLAAIVCAGLSSPAWAVQEDVAKVEKLYAEGATLFNGGRYEEALARFKEAYATYPAANLLFNIARCYEALGKVDLALNSFRQFVKQPGVDPGTKALAERKIVDLEEARRRGITTGGTAQAPLAQVPGVAGSAGEPADEGPPSYTPWQYISLGIGAAALGGGIAAMVLGMQDQNEADDLTDCAEQGDCPNDTRPTLQDIQKKQDDADTKKLIGYVLIGVGSAGLVAGGVLLVLDLMAKGEQEKPEHDQTSASSRRLQWSFAPTRGGAVGALTARF